MEHAEAMIHYILERGEQPVLKDIKMSDIKSESIVGYFEIAHEHECLVSDKIDAIMTKAIEVKDYATENFFRKFVDEQVEEEATTAGILDHLKLATGNAGYMIIDRELGARK